QKRGVTSRPAAQDETRQLPQVNGVSGDAGPADAEEVTSPAQPDPVPQEVKSPAQLGPVPQETVPMPIPAWPSATAVDEAPSRPPPLRRTGKERYAPPPGPGTTPRQPWLVQRTGVLTSELRRALPPWALPLLDSQPVSVWLGARVAITVLAFVAGLML